MALKRRARRRECFIVPHLNRSELNERRRRTERLKFDRNVVWTIWRWLLGIAACCEFITYRVFFLNNTGSVKEEVPKKHWWSVFLRRVEEEAPTIESAVESIVSPWLIVLHLLYFMDAFVQAYDMRSRAIRANEKDRLLHKGKKRVHLDPSLVFVVTLSFYLSILPTWFWWEVATYLGIDAIFTSELVQESTIEYAHYSLGYAVIVYIIEHTSANIETEIKDNLKTFVWSLLPRITRYAIRHPRAFKRHTKTVSTTVIWTKYLMPIRSHFNNTGIFGNLKDVWKKWKQQAQGHKQHKRRKKAWSQLDSSTQKEVAVVVIQRNYRSYCSRKWTRLLKLEQEKQETQMILLLQNAIKKREEQELEQQEQALEELERIRQREKARRKNPKASVVFNPLLSIAGATPTNDEDLKRKYELEEEVQARIKAEKDRTMLLRPDSCFVFRCQIMYVLCAIIETANLLLRHRLDDETRMDSQTVILRLFFGHSYIFVHAILCFGVIVWFFVGEIDPVTGCLVSQSPFSRWIYPGLLLHIAVNPALIEIKQIVKFILEAGPGRSWRWWVLFLLPVWRQLRALWEWKIWMRLVQRKNQKLVEAAAHAFSIKTGRG